MTLSLSFCATSKPPCLEDERFRRPHILTGVVLLAWPFLIGLGLTHNGLHWLLPLMALVLVLRLHQARRNAGPMRYVVQCIALAGLALCAASYLLKAHQWLLLLSGGG